MERLALVTDSVACLPPELAQKYRIRVVPVVLIFEDAVYRDGVGAPIDEFYRLLENSGTFPTTSAPPPGEYLQVFDKALAEAEAVLCVTVASRLSASYSSACRARDMLLEARPQSRVVVLDSRTATMAQGFLVLEAARTVEAGGGLDEALTAAEALRPHLRVVGLLETLVYLAKSGRIPRLVAWAGSRVGAKPLFRIVDGTVNLGTVVRSRQHGVHRLLEVLSEEASHGGRVHAAVLHARAADEAEALRQAVASRLDCAELYVCEFSPLMAAFTGPGLLALAYYVEPQRAHPE